jgi:hypothetical protein
VLPGHGLRWLVEGDVVELDGGVLGVLRQTVGPSANGNRASQQEERWHAHI